MSSPLPTEKTVETAKMAIRVLVADDHELVRDGLKYAFFNTGIEIVAEATDEELVVRLAQQQLCDVILLDIGWPEGETLTPRGFDILRAIKSVKPVLPVVIYSMHDRDRYKRRCNVLGASGYVVKGTLNTTLVEAIRKAYDSARVCDHEE